MNKKTISVMGTVGALLFIIPSILGGLWIDGYSIVSQYISESYASGVPNAEYLRYMYIVGGFLLAVFGFTAPSVLPKSGVLKSGFLAFGVFYGLGTIIVALFPCDFGCPNDVENISISQFIHNISGFLTYLVIPLVIIVIGVTFQKWPGFTRLSKFSIACGGIALAFVFFLFMDANGPYKGLFQRIIETSILFWTIYSSYYILKTYEK